MENEQKKYRGQKYKIIKEKFYDIYSFLVHEGDKKELFKAPIQSFGSLCEKLIAKPILMTQFRVYKPEILIEKAWNQFYFEMLKLYKKYYKQNFKEDHYLFINTLIPPELFTKREIDVLPHLPLQVIRKKLRTKIECFVCFMGKQCWITQEASLGKQYKIFTPWKRIRLWEKIILYPRLLKNKKLREKLAKIMWKNVFEIYKNIVLDRFPNISIKDLNLLEQCLSSPMKEDFYCVPKLNSYFKKPFYFVEIKSTKNKPHTPSLTSNQREFIREFKNKVGILILWIFLNQNKIEVKWLTPDT